jgi:SAM-dependent methyltransferase
MPSKPLAEVHAYWQAAARVEPDRDGLKPTARDPHLQTFVETAIERWIPRGAAVLDVGCGDGTSTLRFARAASRVVGVDYIPQFVQRANTAALAAGVENASFVVGDVLDLAALSEEHGPFDVVVSIRCIINLASLENQVHALSRIASCVRPGGLFLTSEGWREGRDGLNSRRIAAGLAAMDLVDHNLLITREAFEHAAAAHFDVVGYEGAGLYLFISRVLQPLAVAPDEPSVLHPLNAIGADLQIRMNQAGVCDFADCDYAGVYVLRRHAG